MRDGSERVSGLRRGGAVRRHPLGSTVADGFELASRRGCFVKGSFGSVPGAENLRERRLGAREDAHLRGRRAQPGADDPPRLALFDLLGDDVLLVDVDVDVDVERRFPFRQPRILGLFLVPSRPVRGVGIRVLRVGATAGGSRGVGRIRGWFFDGDGVRTREFVRLLLLPLGFLPRLLLRRGGCFALGLLGSLLLGARRLAGLAGLQRLRPARIDPFLLRGGGGGDRRERRLGQLGQNLLGSSQHVVPDVRVDGTAVRLRDRLARHRVRVVPAPHRERRGERREPARAHERELRANFVAVRVGDGDGHLPSRDSLNRRLVRLRPDARGHVERRDRSALPAPRARHHRAGVVANHPAVGSGGGGRQRVAGEYAVDFLPRRVKATDAGERRRLRAPNPRARPRVAKRVRGEVLGDRERRKCFQRPSGRHEKFSDIRREIARRPRVESKRIRPVRVDAVPQLRGRRSATGHDVHRPGRVRERGGERCGE